MQGGNDGSWDSLKSWANTVRGDDRSNAFKARGNWSKFKKLIGNVGRSQNTLNKRSNARDFIYQHYAKQTGAVGQQPLSPLERMNSVSTLQQHVVEETAKGDWHTQVKDQYGDKRVWSADKVEDEPLLQSHVSGGFTYHQPNNRGGRSSKGGRLSVAATKDSYVQLNKNVHELLSDDVGRSGKVTAPKGIHDRADTSVFYLKGSENTRERRETIGDALVQNVDVIDEAPGGMGRVRPGVFTSETPNYVVKPQDPTAHQQSSHGNARSMIIEKAIRSTRKNFGAEATQEQFESVLKYKLARHGLDPEQPSMRKAQPQNLRKPWVPPAD